MFLFKSHTRHLSQIVWWCLSIKTLCRVLLQYAQICGPCFTPGFSILSRSRSRLFTKPFLANSVPNLNRCLRSEASIELAKEHVQGPSNQTAFCGRCQVFLKLGSPQRALSHNASEPGVYETLLTLVAGCLVYSNCHHVAKIYDCRMLTGLP